ncbi:hypothetical protein GUITHDRAFT_147554 [Guillardia theta CCMP2712]|uniref:Uncharacterized protein n=1 Tax=Guillardia theta (strain CCMP2712) TaxID=905079 RepID=L1IDT1_GUITC|nr:hypothetical protein GUITHDRAFT_147554 [Guillardia theta CCMP2712]EKX33985.1 hypothetical protein GUITHDRAFT_147554 [Guillardia theta CCMP2712]|eukprot:XP_005820965.1 hypothetical protein GUITHDRAFT_147554 [Guillardia theta CCMP2712]
MEGSGWQSEGGGPGGGGGGGIMEETDQLYSKEPDRLKMEVERLKSQVTAAERTARKLREDLATERQERTYTEAERRALKEAYDALQQSYEVNGQLLANSNQKVMMLEEECERLRGQMRTSTSVEEYSRQNIRAELQETKEELDRAYNQLEELRTLRDAELEHEKDRAIETQKALENGLFYRDEANRLYQSVEDLERQKEALEKAKGMTLGRMKQLEENLQNALFDLKRERSLNRFVTAGLFMSLEAGKRFDKTYKVFKRRTQELQSQNQHFYHQAVALQARGQYEAASEKYEQALAADMSNTSVLCSYLFLLEHCMDDREASFALLQRLIDHIEGSKLSRTSQRNLTESNLNLLELELSRARKDLKKIFRHIHAFTTADDPSKSKAAKKIMSYEKLSGNESLDSSSNVSSSTIFSKHRDSAHKIAHLQSDISKLLDMHDIKQEVSAMVLQEIAARMQPAQVARGFKARKSRSSQASDEDSQFDDFDEDASLRESQEDFDDEFEDDDDDFIDEGEEEEEEEERTAHDERTARSSQRQQTNDTLDRMMSELDVLDRNSSGNRRKPMR